jgi:hypothetical protein
METLIQEGTTATQGKSKKAKGKRENGLPFPPPFPPASFLG